MSKTAKSTNPATGKKIAEYDRISANEAAKKIKKSHKAWQKWKNTSFKKRAKLMRKAADILEKNKEEYAKLATQEMGKMIGQATGEIEKFVTIMLTTQQII